MLTAADCLNMAFSSELASKRPDDFLALRSIEHRKHDRLEAIAKAVIPAQGGGE
jgi:hypothetical protein